MRRIILTLAGLTVAGALATGCAGTGAATPGAPVGGEVEYQQLLDAIYGTPDDRLVAEKLQHHNIQTAIAECMKAKGHTYRIPAYDGIAGSPIVPGDIDGAAPQADDFGIAAARQQHAEGVEANAQLGQPSGELTDKVKQAAYDDALGTCSSAGAKYQEAHLPSGAEEYGQAIINNLNMITPTEKYRNLHADYLDCLRDAGYTVESWVQLHQLVQQQFPTEELGWTTLSASPAWAEAVAYEREAASADKTCRSGLHAHTMREMAPRVDRLMTEGNGGGVKLVTTAWDRLHKEAAAAGIR